MPDSNTTPRAKLLLLLAGAGVCTALAVYGMLRSSSNAPDLSSPPARPDRSPPTLSVATPASSTGAPSRPPAAKGTNPPSAPERKPLPPLAEASPPEPSEPDASHEPRRHHLIDDIRPKPREETLKLLEALLATTPGPERERLSGLLSFAINRKDVVLREKIRAMYEQTPDSDEGLKYELLCWWAGRPLLEATYALAESTQDPRTLSHLGETLLWLEDRENCPGALDLLKRRLATSSSREMTQRILMALASSRSEGAQAALRDWITRHPEDPGLQQEILARLDPKQKENQAFLTSVLEDPRQDIGAQKTSLFNLSLLLTYGKDVGAEYLRLGLDPGRPEELRIHAASQLADTAYGNLAKQDLAAPLRLSLEQVITREESPQVREFLRTAALNAWLSEWSERHQREERKRREEDTPEPTPSTPEGSPPTEDENKRNLEQISQIYDRVDQGTLTREEAEKLILTLLPPEEQEFRREEEAYLSHLRSLHPENSIAP